MESKHARVSIMNVSIDPFTMEETVNRADEFITSGLFAHMIGVNADKLLQIQDDPAMREIVQGCEIVNADGASMLIAAEKLGVSIPERVAGIDLVFELCRLAQEKSYTVLLIGAREEVVEKTKVELESMFPQLRILGSRDGYFGEDEFEEVANFVEGNCPDITFIGITSPKKERLIEYFRERNLTGVFVGVGGSFDVVSGQIPRAPLWMRRVRMEWLFRMMQEPKRLGKRYIVGNVRFMHLLAKEKRKQKAR
jgi:N-acetylglucosaminyldiphosphoundecaprenol N-acetyl-beta-D-mannosaminyltransferase